MAVFPNDGFGSVRTLAAAMSTRQRSTNLNELKVISQETDPGQRHDSDARLEA
jgi:hypothetical protein